MLSVGVSVPIQLGRKNRLGRELAAKIMQADQVTDEREETLQAHAAEVRVMLGERRSGLERLARYKRELEPLPPARARPFLLHHIEAARRAGRGAGGAPQRTRYPAPGPVARIQDGKALGAAKFSLSVEPQHAGFDEQAGGKAMNRRVLFQPLAALPCSEYEVKTRLPLYLTAETT